MKSHRVSREFGIVIGDKNLWGRGYGIEATELILEYGSKHLKLHRVQLIVLDFNERERVFVGTLASKFIASKGTEIFDIIMVGASPLQTFTNVSKRALIYTKNS